ncbi:MAG: chemotaxis protein CheW, partial [Magnetococcales bacterium]|nr:chemotaxis protein CheW [Magnetococcales bacterium]
PHLERHDRQRILVINLAGKRTGFIVDSVSEVKKIYESSLEDAPSFSDEQSLYVKKVANLGQQKRMILIIELASMMETMTTGG